MRVKLVQESSGFGYSGKLANWLAESDEHIGLMQKLKAGKVVEIPDKYARMIYNLVNVETGEIISRRHSLFIDAEKIAKIYKEHGKEDLLETKETLKNTFTNTPSFYEEEDESDVQEEEFDEYSDEDDSVEEED